ncbi:MAG: GGDEF domain-containing protein [Oceanidesulfovibrio sp.]
MLGEEEAHHPVDLVIIECTKPLDKPLDVLRIIKASREFRSIPVVMVSETDEPFREVRVLEQGAADFWVLPLHETVLRARIALHTQRARSTKSLVRYSMLDVNTGAASRHLFHESLRAEWRRSVREKSWVSLAFIAMDGFETYAERLGRECVEECIQMVAEALKTCLRRPGDMLSRLSEDMFAALLPVTDPHGAPVVSEMMLNSVAALRLAFPGSVARLQLAEHVSISIGTSSATPDSPVGFDRFAESAYAALGLAMAEGPSGMRQNNAGRATPGPVSP